MRIKFSTILEISRIYSLPMTIMSWLVIFVYGIKCSGNVLYGILALLGISFAHLSTNILDDYFDYKLLIKQLDYNPAEYLKNTQQTKCRYLVSGKVGEKDVLLLSGIYIILAGIIGLLLFIKCGVGVIYFASAGFILMIGYSFLSRIKLSELAVAIAYGPAMFGGVFYVMTKTYSPDAYILSVPSTIITVILLYIHTVMDYDFDLKEGKNTIANSFDSQLDSLIVLKLLLIAAYVSPIFLCIFDILDWQVFGVYITIPLAIDLYKSLEDFSLNPKSVPVHKWYHFPMENMKAIKQMNAESFMIRIYQARNIMIYFSTMLIAAVFCSMF